MNIPTSKLRDLVATLQQLDQDSLHNFDTAEIYQTKSGRRYLHLPANGSTLIDFLFFLDKVYASIPRDSCEIAEDLNTPDEFIRKLTTHLNHLHNNIRALRIQVEQLQSTTSTAT